MKLVVFLIALTLSSFANAGLITYSWTNVATTPELLSGSAYWTLDESSLLPATSRDYAADILDFGFEWTTTSGTTSLNRASAEIGYAQMWTDALGEVVGFNICTSTQPTPCEVSVPTTIQLFYGVGWGVSSDNPQGFSVAFENITVIKTVSEIPAASSFSLIALALIALARARFIKRTARTLF